MKNGNSNYLIFITLVATLGGLLFGYDTAVISGTVDSLEQFFIAPKGLSAAAANSLLGFTVSGALIGCIFGGLLGGIVSKRLGRKRGLIIAAILFFVSALGSAMPELGFEKIGQGGHSHLTNFIVYRIIGGIGVGLASMLSPMFISELSPAKIRGRLVSLNQLAIVIGIVVVYFVNYLIALQGDADWLASVGWRWMFASETIPALIFLFALQFVPNSPRYLALNGREEESLEILGKINGLERAKQELAEIKASITQHSAKLFSYGSKIVIIGIMLTVFQQSMGINAVLYYAPEIFKSMGYGNNTSMTQTILVGLVNMLFTLIAIVYVDKWGRKKLQIAGALGMALSMLALGTSFYIDRVGIASLIFMLGFVACFAMSWGPVTWILVSEIFPNMIRARAMALATAATWLSNYFVSWTFPILNNNSILVEYFNHAFAYWLYGGIAIAAVFFMLIFIPETKGKTLEEIEGFWTKNSRRQ